MSPSPEPRSLRAGAGEARDRKGPIPGPLGRLLTGPYAWAVARRNRAFDGAPDGVTHLGKPVISVGNLSVGGTGKTPMVRRIVRILLEAGHHPCIAMRGYRATPGGSDEASVHARNLPGVPVVAQPDRIAGLSALFATEAGRDVDCIVLDDGFQHRRIARDLDIVLIDATRTPFDDALLPAGWLREPVSSLARADAVVITHAEMVDETRIDGISGRIREHGEEVLAVTRHIWTGLDVAGTPGAAAGSDDDAAPGADTERPIEYLEGKRAFVVCAVGNPGPVLAAARYAVGGPLAGSLVLRDHDAYRPGTVTRLLRGAAAARADVILTTDKDWSKLADVPAVRWRCPVARPRLALAFDRGENAFTRAVIAAARAEVRREGP